MPVTLKDIAMLIGISRQAVAAALEGDGSSRVSPETRKKVLALAKELNYIPNAAARKLRGGESRTIGILASLGMPHSNTVFSETCHILRSRGYNCLTMDHASGELPVLCNQLAACGVAGIVVMDVEHTPPKIMPLPELPIVFCRTKYGEADVDVDKVDIGYIATRHLLQHGHKQVYYLAGFSSPSSRRQRGWKQALKDAGADGKVIELRDMDGSADTLEAILKKDGVTALFCSNDFLGAKAIRILRDRNWRIPEDIAVVGCDGHSFVEFTSPSLTTVIQPVHELAEKCAELILNRIANKENGIVLEHVEIPARLWIGGSCGCPERKLEHYYRLNTTGNLEKDYRLNFNSSLWDDPVSSNDIKP